MLLTILKNISRVFAEVYKEFSLESSIHGFKHTTLAKTKLQRCTWAIILLLSFLTAGWLANLIYERHQSANMSVQIINAQYSTSMLELPALTMCHGAIATTDKVATYLSQKQIFFPRGLTRANFKNSIRYMREAVLPKNYFPDEMDQLHQILIANDLSVKELLQYVSPNCSDFMLLCQLEGITMPCSKLIEPLITRYGMCCIFNYEPLHLQRSTETIKLHNSARFGAHYVLSLLMKSYPSEDRMASAMYGDGVKVYLHNRNVQPTTSAMQLLAAADHETIVQLDGKRLISTSDVLGLSDDVKECSADTKDRRYRSENCALKCRNSVIKELCNCAPISATLMEHRVDEECGFAHIQCLTRVIRVADTVIQQIPQCKCPPDCENTEYTATVTAAPLDATEYSPGPFYKQVLQYQNVTALHLSLSGRLTTLQQRTLMVSNINLLSSVGGIFSLFLGCSVISIIEILYFFCIRSVINLRAKVQRKTVASKLADD